jgi:hypothetical protein
MTNADLLALWEERRIMHDKLEAVDARIDEAYGIDERDVESLIAARDKVTDLALSVGRATELGTEIYCKKIGLDIVIRRMQSRGAA